MGKCRSHGLPKSKTWSPLSTRAGTTWRKQQDRLKPEARTGGSCNPSFCRFKALKASATMDAAAGQVRDFAKNSIRLVGRRVDTRGAEARRRPSVQRSSISNLSRQASKEVPEARSLRVRQGGPADSHGFPGHGPDRLLRQAGVHPHQPGTPRVECMAFCEKGCHYTLRSVRSCWLRTSHTHPHLRSSSAALPLLEEESGGDMLVTRPQPRPFLEKLLCLIMPFLLSFV